MWVGYIRTKKKNYYDFNGIENDCCGLLIKERLRLSMMSWVSLSVRAECGRGFMLLSADAVVFFNTTGG